MSCVSTIFEGYSHVNALMIQGFRTRTSSICIGRVSPTRADSRSAPPDRCTHSWSGGDKSSCQKPADLLLWFTVWSNSKLSGSY